MPKSEAPRIIFPEYTSLIYIVIYIYIYIHILKRFDFDDFDEFEEIDFDEF